MDLEQILPDNVLMPLWEKCDFGPNATARGIIRSSLLKVVVGYGIGSGAEGLLFAAGLMSKNGLTAKGKDYLYTACKSYESLYVGVPSVELPVVLSDRERGVYAMAVNVLKDTPKEAVQKVLNMREVEDLPEQVVGKVNYFIKSVRQQFEEKKGFSPDQNPTEYLRWVEEQLAFQLKKAVWSMLDKDHGGH